MLVISRVSSAQDEVGHVEQRQGRVLEQRPAVDDDQVVGVAQPADDAPDVVDGDQLRHLRAGRCQQHADAGAVADERAVDHVHVAVGDVAQDVHDGLVLGVEVEQDAHVAELEAGIHEGDRLAQLRGQGHGEVDRERGAAHAALGREERHHPTRVALDGQGQRRVGRSRLGHHPAVLLALASVHLTDGCAQLVRAEGLDQELTRAGQHRAAEVVGLALDAHHHDRRRRHVRRRAARWWRCRPCRAC